MQALVLEKTDELSLRDIEIAETLGPRDVRIAVRNVGICGSDVHYYAHGEIGPFVVREPMVLGHEAAGVVIEAGGQVTALRVGDRVCMEPGIPDPTSKASRLGMYNLDPTVRFWATPPVHGVLRTSVVHPADFTFKLPENVSLAEGAMVEPLAVGLHAANKAQIRPGDVAVVIGAGTIGLMTALSALAGGCSHVIVSDVLQPKLDLAATLGPVTPVNISAQDLAAAVGEVTAGWGADIVFEASGNERAASGVFELICPGGRVVFIGMPGAPIAYDVVAAQIVEARVEHIFRYAHVYPRALALMAGKKIDVKPMITDLFPFERGIEAFDFARHMPPTSVKAQIELGDVNHA
jgi:D-xylulose reductase